MKILVIAVMPPNPAAEANHAFYLCRHLADHGVEVHVLSQEGSIVVEHPNIFLHPIMRRWDWRDLPRLRSIIQQCSPEAILLYYLGHIYNHNPMITFAPTLSKRLLPKVPFVTLFSHIFGASSQSRSLSHKLFHRGVRTFTGKSTHYNLGTLLRDSSKIIVMSDKHRAIFENYLPGVARKSVLLPPPLIIQLAPNVNGTTRQEVRTRLNVEPDEFVLTFFRICYPH